MSSDSRVRRDHPVLFVVSQRRAAGPRSPCPSAPCHAERGTDHCRHGVLPLFIYTVGPAGDQLTRGLPGPAGPPSFLSQRRRCTCRPVEPPPTGRLPFPPRVAVRPGVRPAVCPGRRATVTSPISSRHLSVSCQDSARFVDGSLVSLVPG